MLKLAYKIRREIHRYAGCRVVETEKLNVMDSKNTVVDRGVSLVPEASKITGGSLDKIRVYGAAKLRGEPRHNRVIANQLLGSLTIIVS